MTLRPAITDPIDPQQIRDCIVSGIGSPSDERL
jgi:hypothetical protein